MNSLPSSQSSSLWPVILSGGSGTRLWPLSRSFHPKQLLPVVGHATMLQATAMRVQYSPRFQKPLIVTSEDHRFLVAEQMHEAGLSYSGIILEPTARNTAPAIALAAQHAYAQDPQSLILVMPADHVIMDEEAFIAAVELLMPAAEAGFLGTFGIRPDRPETGFGYIHMGQPLPGTPGVNAVNSFVEKPDPATAARFLETGEYLWNGGIFLFRSKVLMDAVETFAPDVAQAARTSMEQADNDGTFIRPYVKSFIRSPNISIDHAVMEKADHVAVAPVDMKWSDVGSWDAVWELSDKDVNGNACAGDVVAVDSARCLLRSEDGQTIVAVGLSDIVAISTKDALLLVPRERAQDVKSAVDILSSRSDGLHQIHKRVHRPWGFYEQTSEGERFQTKRLMVKPGKKLSLQMHHHRSEHWVVVSGTAKVQVGDLEFLLQENESTYIPAGTIHRLTNPGHVPLHVVEVQCGPYLGEDDIVRVEDDYRR